MRPGYCIGVTVDKAISKKCTKDSSYEYTLVNVTNWVV